MTKRLKDSERTRLIAEFIRTGKSPAGYEITVNESSKYKVRKLKSQQEMLQAKKERLTRQLEAVEAELKDLELKDDTPVATLKEIKDDDDSKTSDDE